MIEYDGYPDSFEGHQQKVNIFLEYYGIKKSETFFIGGTTTNSETIAVCFPEDSSLEPYYIAMDEFPLNPQSIEDIQGAVYTFEEMKEYAIKHPTSPWLYIIIAVVVCAAVAVTVIIVKKHRSKV